VQESECEFASRGSGRGNSKGEPDLGHTKIFVSESLARSGSPDLLRRYDKDKKWVRKDQLAPGDEKMGIRGDPQQASVKLGEMFVGFKTKNASLANSEPDFGED
jgi:hypothetical protein